MPGEVPLLFVDYTGFADRGRVVMRIGRNFVMAKFSHHPMVVAEEAEWSHRMPIVSTEVDILFSLLMTAPVRHHQEPPLTLMPGQDATMKTLLVSEGKSPPFLSVDFVETPAVLEPVMTELECLYNQVKAARS